jgi:RNA polymerase-binding transcription factor DksA
MYARILVPIDGSGAAGHGPDEAIALARHFGSTLHVLNDRTYGNCVDCCEPIPLERLQV